MSNSASSYNLSGRARGGSNRYVDRPTTETSLASIPEIGKSIWRFGADTRRKAGGRKKVGSTRDKGVALDLCQSIGLAPMEGAKKT